MQTNQAIHMKLKSSVKPVTDIDVTKVLNLRESKAFLKKRLEQIDSDLESMESELIERIKSGASIECKALVSVKTSERRYTSWKKAFLKFAGEQESKKIIDATEPTVTKSLIISTK